MLTIEKREEDPHTAELVEQAFGMITPRWRRLLPPLTVRVANKRFDRIPELKEFCKAQSREPGWEKSRWEVVKVICAEFDKDGAVLWARRDPKTVMHPPDYYFQKNFFEVVAKVMWFSSEELREAVRIQGARYINFRDTFSRFFLNPDWLQERREEAWAFICRLDRELETEE